MEKGNVYNILANNALYNQGENGVTILTSSTATPAGDVFGFIIANAADTTVILNSNSGESERQGSLTVSLPVAGMWITGRFTSIQVTGSVIAYYK